VRTAALLAVGVLIAASVAWFAAEQHYENCVTAAEARAPVGEAGSLLDESESLLDEPGSVQEEFERFTGEAQRRRREAIEGCSRVPW
jgi:hypothetical protein